MALRAALLPAAALLGLAACDHPPGPAPETPPPAAHAQDAHAPDSHALHAAAHAEDQPASVLRRAAAMLADIQRDNGVFIQHHGRAHFAPFAHEQHPRAVVVACSDSRFHVEALDRTPDGDIFEVRNIGNQVDTAEGSVEYAVEHLHTPLLVVVGHVGCGAIRAAMEDYSAEPPALRRELNGLHLAVSRVPGHALDDARWHAVVVANVHEQVAEAMREYRAQVESGRLHVVGALYDFTGDVADAPGRLVLINVNGVADPHAMAEQPLLRVAGHLH